MSDGNLLGELQHHYMLHIVSALLGVVVGNGIPSIPVLVVLCAHVA